MSGCEVCGSPLTSSRQRRFCSAPCRSAGRYLSVADLALGLISREQGATAKDLRALFASHGYSVEGYRYVVRLLRLMFHDDSIVVHERGAYRLPVAPDEAQHWIARLAAQRMRELTNVREYAAHCRRIYGSSPVQSRLWAVVEDDLDAAVRHFAFATETDES